MKNSITIFIGLIIGIIFLSFSLKIAFVVILGSLFSIYLILNPEQGLLLTIAAIPFEMVGRVTEAKSSMPISISKVLGAVTFIGFLWNTLTLKKKIVLPRSFILLVIFTIAAVINYNFVLDKKDALTGLQRIAVTLGFYFLIIQLVDNKKMLKRSLWAITISLIITAIASIAQRFGLSVSFQEAVETYGTSYGAFVENLDTSNYLRTTGFYADPDIFAFALLIPIGIVLLQLSKKDTIYFEKPIMISTLFILIGGIISSHSRTGLVGLFVLITLFFIRIIKPKIIVLSFIMIAGFLSSPLLPSSYLDRIKSIFDPDKSYTSASRLTIYKDAFKMYKDNWFIGVGTDNFPANFERYTESDIRPAGTMNLYLQVATEYGTVGLILFSLILWDIFSSIRLLKKRLIYNDTEYYHLLLAIEIIIIALMVCGLTIHTMERKEFWLMLAIPIAAQRIFLKERDGDRII